MPTGEWICSGAHQTRRPDRRSPFFTGRRTTADRQPPSELPGFRFSVRHRRKTMAARGQAQARRSARRVRHRRASPRPRAEFRCALPPGARHVDAVITSIRAQRFARLQMDFVTAVSHELRTPLTIIGSADNIANGVVDTQPQLREYGSVMAEEVGRLSGLVERVLLFAATRDGQQRHG